MRDGGCFGGKSRRALLESPPLAFGQFAITEGKGARQSDSVRRLVVVPERLLGWRAHLELARPEDDKREIIAVRPRTDFHDKPLTQPTGIVEEGSVVNLGGFALESPFPQQPARGGMNRRARIAAVRIDQLLHEPAAARGPQFVNRELAQGKDQSEAHGLFDGPFEIFGEQVRVQVPRL